MESLKQTEIEWGNNPYIGPRTFSPNEAEKFFGRDKEARDLIGLIVSHPTVLFYAQSGSGKSSLINAKIIPGLTNEGFEVLPVGRVSGESGLETDAKNVFVYNLISSLHQRPIEPKNFPQLSLSEFLDNLIHVDDQFFYDDQYEYKEDEELKPRVLFIDQFEEILTTNTSFWEARELFFHQLGEALRLDDQLWIVLTMREDFIGGLDPYAHYLPNDLRDHFYMQQLEREAALKAIKNPAMGAKRPFAEGAAEILVDNLRELRREETGGKKVLGKYVEPVQLQAVCYQMWEKLKTKPGDQISKENVLAYADVNTALIYFYQDTIADTVADTDVTEPDLRNWFTSALITEAGTRNMVFRGDEWTGSLSTPVADYVKDKFILREVVRPGGVWYELVHDRFVKPILSANREWQHEQPLIRLAQRWAEENHNEAHLLGARQLAEYTKSDENWQALGPIVVEYVEASQTALEDRKEEARQIETAHREALAEEKLKRAEEAELAAARQKKLKNGSIALAILATFLAIFAVFFAFSAQKQREIAEGKANIASIAEANALNAQATAEAEKQIANNNREKAVAESTRAALAEQEARDNQKSAELAEQEANSLRYRAIGNAEFDNNPTIGYGLLIEGWSELQEGETAVTEDTKQSLESDLKNLLHTGIISQQLALSISPVISDTYVWVNYPDNTPDELWDATTGETVQTLNSNSTYIDPLIGTNLFAIYHDNGQVDFHDKENGNKLHTFTEKVSSIAPISNNTPIIAIYDTNGNVAALWDSNKNVLLQDLNALTDSVDFLYDTPIFTFYHYEDEETTTEVYRKEDGTRLTEASVSYVNASPQSLIYIIAYTDGTFEVHNNNHEVLQSFADNTSYIDTLYDTQNFAVFYQDGVVEMYDKTNGQLSYTFTNNISSISPIPNSPYFITYFNDGSTPQILSVTNPLQDLQGDINYVDGLSKLPFFAIYYLDGVIEFRDKEDGSSLNIFNERDAKEGKVTNIAPIFYDVPLPLFTVSYEDGKVELWGNATDDNPQQISTNYGTPSVDSMYDSPIFALYLENGDIEVRSKEDGELIKTFSNIAGLTAVSNSTFILVSYPDQPSQLWNYKTEANIELNGSGATTYPLPDTNYFNVYYNDGKVELRDNETGGGVQINDQIATHYILLNQNPTYEVFTDQNGQSNLLREGELIVQFESFGVPVLFPEQNKLIILQGDYMKEIDLELLEQLGGDPLKPQENLLASEALVQLVCDYISIPVTEIEEIYLDGETMQACQEK